MRDIWQFLEPGKIIRQASLGPPVYLLLLWHPCYSTLGVPECITTLGRGTQQRFPPNYFENTF